MAMNESARRQQLLANLVQLTSPAAVQYTHYSSTAIASVIARDCGLVYAFRGTTVS